MASGLVVALVPCVHGVHTAEFQQFADGSEPDGARLVCFHTGVAAILDVFEYRHGGIITQWNGGSLVFVDGGLVVVVLAWGMLVLDGEGSCFVVGVGGGDGSGVAVEFAAMDAGALEVDSFGGELFGVEGVHDGFAVGFGPVVVNALEQEEVVDSALDLGIALHYWLSLCCCDGSIITQWLWML